MVRIAVIALIVVVALLGIAQLAVPPLAEKKIEDRLTEDGGTAEANVDAPFPAALLLAGDGDALEVTGSGLDLEIDDEDSAVFDRLDGFDRVDVDMSDFRAGPFDVDSFELSRDGSGPYALRSSSTTTGAALVSYGASRLGVPGASLIPLVTGEGSAADRPIPVELDMQLESDDGRITVTSGGGTIAGYPTGPLAELITRAIVVRL
jgi:hypothetical protein